MEVLQIIVLVLAAIVIPGVYFGIVAAIAITVCKALLKKK